MQVTHLDIPIGLSDLPYSERYAYNYVILKAAPAADQYPFRRQTVFLIFSIDRPHVGRSYGEYRSLYLATISSGNGGEFSQENKSTTCPSLNWPAHQELQSHDRNFNSCTAGAMGYYSRV